ncbi:MAG: DUF58 domain-containing protein [Paracoccaceae bacterium]
MFFEKQPTTVRDNPAGLTLDELLAVKPSHLRGKLGHGSRGPDGERPGRGRAYSLDFDGLSPYSPGDDVRWIDWRASLRSGQTMARRYAAASYRAQMLVLEIGPDLHFGTSVRVMAKTAALTAGLQAWRALALNEPVGLMTMGTVIPPRRGRRHVLRLLEHITTAFEASMTQSGHAPDFETAASLVGHQDEICVVAEMPSSPLPMIELGRALAGSRILRFCIVEDPLVRTPLPSGRYPVRGPDGVRHLPKIRTGQRPNRQKERALGDAGWRIEQALDLLPQETQ